MNFLMDTRVNCCSLITDINAAEYLKFIDDAYKNRGGIEGQRDPLKTTTAIRIRKRMIDDLKQGAVLPPVVLGIIIGDGDLNLIKSGEVKDILNHIKKLDKENISIIDGMQRTTALIELSRQADITGKNIWIEYWMASNINSLIYRMLILNTGQVPWNLRRQIEIIFRAMIKDIKINVPTMELFDLNTNKRRMKSGQFQANEVIELFLVFGARKEKIDTKERLADEFTRMDFIEATGDPQFSNMFYKVLGFLSEIDRAFGNCETASGGDKFKVGKDLFSSQPASVGFVAAMALEIMGRPGIDRPYELQKKRLEAQLGNVANFLHKLEGLNSSELSNFLDFSTLNQLIVDRKAGKAVGDFEREFFLKAFQILIEEKFEVEAMTPCWRAY